jgi:hypothetical protein
MSCLHKPEQAFGQIIRGAVQLDSVSDPAKINFHVMQN